MSFMPISKCCLQGAVMSGTPRGAMQLAGKDGVTVDRYHVKPTNGEVVSDKIALVIFYDLLGFSLPNPKLIADTYADQLGLNVFVPDYLPYPMPSSYLEPSATHYPNQKQGQGMLAAVWDKVRLLPLAPLFPFILDWKVTPLVDKAIADLQNQGYTQIVSVGYCRGGSVNTYLLAKGDECPVSAAVVMHPTWNPERWPKIRKPSLWILADHDDFIPAPRREELLEAFKNNTEAEFEHKFFPDTVHGFGCRPASEHEPTQKAFNEANALAVEFLKRKLVI